MSEYLSPLVTDAAIGGIGGFAVGYLLKKVYKIVAMIFGAYLLSLNFLSNKGLISIHFDKWQSIGGEIISEISSIESNTLPISASFVGGLYWGFTRG